MRLLLVESDQATAQALIKTLKQGGITVDHAHTGHEAIDMLRHYDYDLALTELTLEDLEGYEVIRRVRKTQIQTPIIVLSGLNRAEAKIKHFMPGLMTTSPSPSIQKSLWLDFRPSCAARGASAPLS